MPLAGLHTEVYTCTWALCTQARRYAHTHTHTNAEGCFFCPRLFHAKRLNYPFSGRHLVFSSKTKIRLRECSLVKSGLGGVNSSFKKNRNLAFELSAGSSNSIFSIFIFIFLCVSSESGRKCHFGLCRKHCSSSLCAAVSLLPACFWEKFHFLVGHIRCWAVSWIKQLLPAWHHTAELRFHYPHLHKADNQLLSAEPVWRTWEEPVTCNTKTKSQDLRSCFLFFILETFYWVYQAKVMSLGVRMTTSESSVSPFYSAVTEVKDRYENQNLISDRWYAVVRCSLMQCFEFQI